MAPISAFSLLQFGALDGLAGSLPLSPAAAWAWLFFALALAGAALWLTSRPRSEPQATVELRKAA